MTMKKQYITPSIVEVKIKKVTLLAGSETVPVGEGTKPTSAADSRGFSFFDDEEDDEY